MATYDLEEQEQLAEIKVWWKQYGNLVINVFTAVMLAVSAMDGLELVSAQSIGTGINSLQCPAEGSSGQGFATNQGSERRVAG